MNVQLVETVWHRELERNQILQAASQKPPRNEWIRGLFINSLGCAPSRAPLEFFVMCQTAYWMQFVVMDPNFKPVLTFSSNPMSPNHMLTCTAEWERIYSRG